MIILWSFFYGIFYTLREIPHIWGVSTTYKLRYSLPTWFTTTEKHLTLFHKLTFQIFTNGYHFLGNIGRVLLAPVLYYDAIIINYSTLSMPEIIVSVCAYYTALFIGRKLSMFIFVVKI